MMPEYLAQHTDGIVNNPTFDRYLDRLSGLYFHGMPLQYVIFHDFFRRFGHSYLYHGLCFQTAGLAMLIYRDNPSARIVQAMVKKPCCGNIYTSHSWLEFCEFGSRWIIDMGWNYPLPVPVSLGELRLGEGDIRRKWTCSYEKFWNAKNSVTLLKALENPEISYIMQALNVFCPAFNPYNDGAMRQWGFKIGGKYCIGTDDFNYFELDFDDGVFTREASTYIDFNGAPVTQEVIKAFVVKSKRKDLPAKVYRREINKLRRMNYRTAESYHS